MEPRLYLDLDRNEPWSSPKSVSPHVSEAAGSNTDLSERVDSDEAAGEDEASRGVRQRPRGELLGEEHSRSPRRGLNKYLCRFDDAMKLRGQLANEKAAQEDGSTDVEELDSFRFFRLAGSISLAVFVRIFVCQYLVSVTEAQVRPEGFVLANAYLNTVSFVFPVHICTIPHP